MAAAFGVRWQEVNRKNQVITKEKIFRTGAEMDDFVDELMEKANFVQILATR